MSLRPLAPVPRSIERLRPGCAPFWRGVLASAAVMAAFVAFGLGLALVERTARATSYLPAMPGATEAETGPEPSVWLVDGYNVLHAGVLRGRDRAGWWKAEAQSRVVAVADGFEDPEAEVWVVFDAARPEAASERCAAPVGGRLHVVFAPSADDWIVKRVRGHAEPGRLAVVTADRQVAERARHRGARVVSPLAFLRRCSSPAGAPAQPSDAEPDA